MQQNSISSKEQEPPFPSTKRLFHRVTTNDPQGEEPLNIFRKYRGSLTYDPSERPVGGTTIARRIRDNFVKPSVSDIHQITLSTKVEPSVNLTHLKTKTDFNCTSPKLQEEETLKSDLTGFSLDKLKSTTIRSFRSTDTSTYDKKIEPFLKVMGQRSMSAYNDDLVKKLGDKYFEKTLRNAYQDEPGKNFIVTLFDKGQCIGNGKPSGEDDSRPRIRKRKANDLFFKKIQFMEVTGSNKKDKQYRSSQTNLDMSSLPHFFGRPFPHSSP